MSSTLIPKSGPEGAHLLHALRPPQAYQPEQPDAHTGEVADGSAHMQEQDDGIDAHFAILSRNWVVGQWRSIAGSPAAIALVVV